MYNRRFRYGFTIHIQETAVSNNAVQNNSVSILCYRLAL